MVWFCQDWDAIERLHQDRLGEKRMNVYFWEEGESRVVMSRVVEEKLDELKGCCGSEKVEGVLDAVKGLLVLDAKERVTSRGFAYGLVKLM